MSWNYRIVRLTEPDGSPYYEIREAYYEGTANVPHMITESAARPGGGCLTALRKDLALMIEAFNHTPLREQSFAGTVPAPRLADTLRKFDD